MWRCRLGFIVVLPARHASSLNVRYTGEQPENAVLSTAHPSRMDFAMTREGAPVDSRSIPRRA